MNTEELARVQIDKLLQHAGWEVQERAGIGLFSRAERRVAVREAMLATGLADYLLFVDGKQGAGCHRDHKGRHDPSAASRTSPAAAPRAVSSDAGLAADNPLPFRYESTGLETFFTNILDPEPLSRRVFAFHRPT